MESLLPANKRFKDLRRFLSFKQDEFAERLGVSKSYLSSIEMGRRSISKNIAFKIQQDFDISMQWLLSGIGDKFLSVSDKELFFTPKQLHEMQKGYKANPFRPHKYKDQVEALYTEFKNILDDDLQAEDLEHIMYMPELKLQHFGAFAADFGHGIYSEITVILFNIADKTITKKKGFKDIAGILEKVEGLIQPLNQIDMQIGNFVALAKLFFPDIYSGYPGLDETFLKSFKEPGGLTDLPKKK